MLADHFLTVEDTIDVLGKSLLGLTVGCARCHDHKYDAIPQSDYYALYGIFESTPLPRTRLREGEAATPLRHPRAPRRAGGRSVGCAAHIRRHTR